MFYSILMCDVFLSFCMNFFFNVLCLYKRLVNHLSQEFDSILSFGELVVNSYNLICTLLHKHPTEG